MTTSFAWPDFSPAGSTPAGKDLETLRRQAAADAEAVGYAEGRKAGAAAMEAELEALRERFAASIASLDALRSEFADAQLAALTEAMKNVCSTLIGAELEHNVALLPGLVRRALDVLDTPLTELVVKLAPADHQALAGRVPEGVQVEADDSLPVGTVTVVGRDGILEFDPGKALDQALTNAESG